MKIRSIDCEPPILRKVPKKNYWEYAANWAVRIRTAKDGMITLTIQVGYWTDLASVPKALRGMFDNGSAEYGVLVASQIHDALYSTHYLSKELSDEIFYRALKYYKMNCAKAWLYYKAVSWFGDSAWEYHDETLAERDRELIRILWTA